MPFLALIRGSRDTPLISGAGSGSQAQPDRAERSEPRSGALDGTGTAELPDCVPRLSERVAVTLAGVLDLDGPGPARRARPRTAACGRPQDVPGASEASALDHVEKVLTRRRSRVLSPRDATRLALSLAREAVA